MTQHLPQPMAPHQRPEPSHSPGSWHVARVRRPPGWMLGLGLGLWMLCLWGATTAQAQVVRCTDARSGKVTYTDGKCAPGAAGVEVESRQSALQIQEERERAEQAIERKQERRAAEAIQAERQARAAAQQERLRADRAAAARPSASDYARSPGCAQARRQLDIVSSGVVRDPGERDARLLAAQQQMDWECLGPERYAEVEAARGGQPRTVVVPSAPYPGLYPSPYPPPVQPQPPQQLQQCGAFRCTDNLGNSYPRTGPGRFPGPGGVCRSLNSGGHAPC